jgi:hypothetical protein
MSDGGRLVTMHFRQFSRGYRRGAEALPAMGKQKASERRSFAARSAPKARERAALAQSYYNRNTIPPA